MFIIGAGMSERLSFTRSRDSHGQPVQSAGRYLGRDYLPGGIRMIGTAGYAGVLSILWATFGGDSATVFALTIITQLALMHFGFAFLLRNATVAKRDACAQKIQSRSQRDFNMLTGRISGWSVFA
jgi:hypothetical protein